MKYKLVNGEVVQHFDSWLELGEVLVDLVTNNTLTCFHSSDVDENRKDQVKYIEVLKCIEIKP